MLYNKYAEENVTNPWGNVDPGLKANYPVLATRTNTVLDTTTKTPQLPVSKGRRWLMWCVATLAYLLIVSQRFAPAAVVGTMMQRFTIGAAEIGILAALQFFVYMLLQIPAGTLADLLGPRRVLCCGTALAGIGTIIFGLSLTFPVALVGRALLGLGDALMFVNIMRLQASWFEPREYATLSGLVMCASGLGGVLATAPLVVLVDLAGFTMSFVGAGILLLMLSVLIVLVVRDRQAGILEQRPGLLRPLISIASNARSWPPFLVQFGIVGPVVTFTSVWGIPFLMEARDMSHTAAAVALGLFSIGMSIGGPLIGFISDRIERRRIPLIVATGTAACLWLVLIAGGTSLPLSLIIGTIFLLGMVSSISSVGFALIKEVNDVCYSGQGAGFMNAGGFLCVTGLQLAVGYLLSIQWTGEIVAGERVYSAQAFSHSFWLLLAMTLVALLGALLARETYGQQEQ